MSSISRQQLIEYIKTINLVGKTLDVGCGDPKYWAKNFCNDLSTVYHTLDIDKQFKPTFTLDLNTEYGASAWSASPKPNYYDTIVSFETFEHVYNPYQAAMNVYGWLKPGGVFYFSAPFINPIHESHDMLRLTSEWWYMVLNKIGFKKIEVKERKASAGAGLLQAFYRSEGLRMSKIRLKNGESHKLIDIGYMGRAEK